MMSATAGSSVQFRALFLDYRRQIGDNLLRILSAFRLTLSVLTRASTIDSLVSERSFCCRWMFSRSRCSKLSFVRTLSLLAFLTCIRHRTNPEAFRGRGIAQIVKDEGFGLYRGAGWTAARNAPGSFAVRVVHSTRWHSVVSETSWEHRRAQHD